MDLGLKVLLPHLSGMEVEQVEVTADSILIDGVSTAVGAACPGCRVPARRVHSRYVRRLADVAVGGRRVLIRVRVRWFFCEDDSCEARTFVEQVDGLTRRHARRSPPLRRMLEAISLAVCARAGTRLAAKLGVATSRSGLLRLIRAMPDPPVPATRVLGVDDFALKRGHVYGTVLIDCETHQVNDVLETRDAAPLTAWLDAHPGTEIICRDRSSAYGARTGAPDAIQVADRFHLWQNLATAVERCVAGHKSCLRPDPPPAEAETAPAGPPDEPDPTGRLADRRREHHALVHDLLGQGMAIRQIAGHLGWGRHTVQRYARATTWQQMIVGRRRPATSLDPYKAHLQAGYTGRHGNTQALHREITALGFTGSYSTVRDYLQRRPTPDLPPPAAPPPSVRRVTGWLCRHPDNQATDDIPALADILQRCPELLTAHQLVREFATMLTHRTGNTTLTTWIAAAVAAGLPGISTFAQHLTTDLDAVTAGLTLHWNSGPVEGNVNRIKMLKRQMYGRASFDLLRKRILLA
ncbi:ISL3 family transposase [Catenuloplanes japonicus]|uniref:ISL3 family transposase n=1 Tax=Catenuloplanes japonicus TaxID=33876 RepID=UPI0005248824|nr:ISL3 family transposase [Catenuloplanes japonicus]